MAEGWGAGRGDEPQGKSWTICFPFAGHFSLVPTEAVTADFEYFNGIPDKMDFGNIFLVRIFSLVMQMSWPSERSKEFSIKYFFQTKQNKGYLRK